MRVVYGFTAPATAQIQLKSEMADWVRDNGESSFKQTWYGLLDKYGDYDTAMTEWVKRYPDQMPFTVSESDRSTVAYFRYAKESGDFVDGNEALFKSYPQGAAFLIPHKAGYSWDAYKTMTDMGLRKNKAVFDFMREVQTAADMQTYYEKKNNYEENLKTVGTDFERSQLRKEFTDWSTIFKAGRPLVQEELAQGGKKAIERMKALNDLQKMLDEKAAYKAAPDTANKLRQMMDIYNSYKTSKDEFDAVGGSQFLAQMNKEETIIKMRELSQYNENTMSAYNVLFGRLLGD
jgi:glutaredoxin-related protein